MTDNEFAARIEANQVIANVIRGYQRQLAEAQAERDAARAALSGLVEHIERLFGDQTHPSMAIRALRVHARAALEKKNHAD